MREKDMRIPVNANIGLLALIAGLMLFGSYEVSAQGNSRWAHEKNRVRKEQKAIEKADKREQKAIEKARKHGYRLHRGSDYYETDQRGVELIRRAVNSGYQQGFRSGADDRRYARRSDYRDEQNYRSGTFGYQSYVDRDQYQYYYREGFERGYRDAYTAQPQFGTYSGGKWSILSNVLNSILNLRSF
jgi:hypothetical protein